MIRLWQERQSSSELPTVSDVAEGLNISVDDAESLLEEVRTREAELERIRTDELAHLEAAERLRAQEQQQLDALVRERSALRRERAALNRRLTQERLHTTPQQPNLGTQPPETEDQARVTVGLRALEREFLRERRVKSAEAPEPGLTEAEEQAAAAWEDEIRAAHPEVYGVPRQTSGSAGLRLMVVVMLWAGLIALLLMLLMSGGTH